MLERPPPSKSMFSPMLPPKKVEAMYTEEEEDRGEKLGIILPNFGIHLMFKGIGGKWTKFSAKHNTTK